MTFIQNNGDMPLPSGVTVEIVTVDGQRFTTHTPEKYDWKKIARYKIANPVDVADMMRMHVNARGGSTHDNGAWSLMMQAADAIDAYQQRIDALEAAISDGHARESRMADELGRMNNQLRSNQK